MLRYIAKSFWLLFFSVVICCVLYPLVLWSIGQAAFPFQANGSLLTGPDGKPVGSRLIAQPFTKDEYFQPRPSAASYNAAASASSSLAASNYALRDRVARTLGPIVKYRSGARAGQLVAPDVESWFGQDKFQGNPHIVAQWADLHNSLAQAWVNADPKNGAYVDDWAKKHPANVAKWIKDNPGTPQPKAVAGGKTETTIEPVGVGADIQSIFFDMWRQEHPDADIQDVPGDLVTTSASGLDPHITLQSAEFQLERVSSAWAAKKKTDASVIRKDIGKILQRNAAAPWEGLIGEKFVNVVEVNLELRKLYGAP